MRNSSLSIIQPIVRYERSNRPFAATKVHRTIVILTQGLKASVGDAAMILSSDLQRRSFGELSDHDQRNTRTRPLSISRWLSPDRRHCRERRHDPCGNCRKRPAVVASAWTSAHAHHLAQGGAVARTALHRD